MAHERGLLEKVPLANALEILIEVSLAVQADSRALTVEGLVPPPARVSDGENVTLAETEQLTDPGATSAAFTAEAELTGIKAAATPRRHVAGHIQRRRAEGSVGLLRFSRTVPTLGLPPQRSAQGPLGW